MKPAGSKARTVLRKLRRALVPLAVVGLTFAAILVLRSPGPLERAARVASTLRLNTSHGTGWVSDRELFVWQIDQNDQDEPAVIDVETGKLRILTTLSESLRATLPGKFSDWYWSPSPDGRWLFGVRRWSQVEALLFGVKDGSVRPLPYGQYLTAQWLKDGSGFMETGGRAYRFYDTRRPDRPRSVRLDPATSFDAYHVQLAGSGAHDPATGNLVVIGPSPRFPGRMVRTTAHLRAAPITFESTPVTLPAGSAIRSTCVSPDGRRVLWLVDYTRVPRRTAWDRMRARLMPNTMNRAYGELYVSRSDGNDWRLLGAFDPEDSREAIQYPRWTPDGRRIVFERELSLWITPAD